MGTLAVCAAVFLLLIAAAHNRGHEEVEIYIDPGSNVLLPGVETELKGNGVLEWSVEKTDSAAPVHILRYHYETTEAEVQRVYEQRVNLSFTNGSLALSNVTIPDSGRYILNLISEGKTYVRVLKVVEPVSDIEMMTVPSPSECHALLRCNASGDVRNMTLRTNSGELIQNVTRLGNVLEVLIKVDSNDTFTCRAWNPVNEQETTYQLPPASYDGLLLIGLLIAALTFSIPNLLCWTTFLSSKFRFCRNAKTAILRRMMGACAERPKWSCGPALKGAAVNRSALVSWFLFLICSLISASVAQSVSTAQSANVVYPSTVPYGWPEFNVVYLAILICCSVLDVLLFLSDVLKISLERCSCFKGALQIVNIALQLCAVGFSMAALSYYCKTSCRQPGGFALTISLSVLVPVGTVALVSCVCRYCCLNDRLGDGDTKGSLEENNPQSMEMEENAGKAPVHNPDYVKVPTREEIVGP